MNTTRSLLERISPANASTSTGRVDTNFERTRPLNEGETQQKMTGGSASLLSGPGAGTATQQLSGVSTTPLSNGSKKRKRTTADNGEAEKEKVQMRREPEKLLTPWFPVTSANDLLPQNASHADR